MCTCRFLERVFKPVFMGVYVLIVEDPWVLWLLIARGENLMEAALPPIALFMPPIIRTIIELLPACDKCNPPLVRVRVCASFFSGPRGNVLTFCKIKKKSKMFYLLFIYINLVIIICLL